MAPPSLLEIGKEGFDLIDQFYGKHKYHQQPCTYHKPETPLIIEKPPVYSQPIYHPSQDQIIAFRTVDPSSIRRVYIYQYSNPIPNSNPRGYHTDDVPSKEKDEGEPNMAAEAKYSGKWKKWNMGLTRF